MIRRALTRILMVILIAACGYNGWQVHLLQEQVRRLQQEKQGNHSVGRAAVPSSQGSWLEQANARAARAASALERGDLADAQRELARSAQDLERAAREPAQRTQSAISETQQSVKTLTARLQTLQAQVHSLSAHAGPVEKRLQTQVGALETQARSLFPSEQRDAVSKHR